MPGKKLTFQQKSDILYLNSRGFGARKIQLIMGVNRSTIQKVLRENGIFNKDVRCLRPKPIEQICKICSAFKPIDQFRKRERKGRVSWEVYCFECEREYGKQSNKKRYLKNRKLILAQAKKYREKEENKKRYRIYCRSYNKNRKKTDPHYKLRCSFSTVIGNALRKRGSFKDESIIKILNYTIEDLRKHLEAQFEPWMNWSNHGKYLNSVWDDNDQSTWTWQIDHIIPVSHFKFTSVYDEEFRKCWALENLRPLSAKQNVLESNRR